MAVTVGVPWEVEAAAATAAVVEVVATAIMTKMGKATAATVAMVQVAMPRLSWVGQVHVWHPILHTPLSLPLPMLLWQM